MDSQPEAAGLRQHGDLNPGLSTFASCTSDRVESVQSSGLLGDRGDDWHAGQSRREL